MSEIGDDDDHQKKLLNFSEIDSKKWIKKRPKNIDTKKKKGNKSNRSDNNHLTPKRRGESSKNSEKEDNISFDHYHHDENR